MIYLEDDYLEKYISVFSYIFERSAFEKYSLSYVQNKIAYSVIANELERSNITTIAFSSKEKIYADLFPDFEVNDFKSSLYNIYGWLGYLYVHLFLDLKLTWEMLFIILPLKRAMEMYPLYHEMDYKQSLEYVKSLRKYSNLDSILTIKKISTLSLAKSTSIPEATLKAIRYNHRDISKLSVSSVSKIALHLGVKIESLLPSLDLECA